MALASRNLEAAVGWVDWVDWVDWVVIMVHPFYKDT